MANAKAESWVVYHLPVKGSPDGLRAVCTQPEWDAMDRQKPGFFTLVQAGIQSEGEAERLARGKSGETPPRTSSQRSAAVSAAGARGLVVVSDKVAD